MRQFREWIVADLAITQRYHVFLVTPKEFTALAKYVKPSGELKRGPLQPYEDARFPLMAISVEADGDLIAPGLMLAEARRHDLTPQLYFNFRSWVPQRVTFQRN